MNILIKFATLLLLISCDSSKESVTGSEPLDLDIDTPNLAGTAGTADTVGTADTPDFTETSFLAYTADSLIYPEVLLFEKTIAEAETAFKAYAAAPSSELLTSLQNQIKSSHNSLVRLMFFKTDFPAMKDNRLEQSLNFHPIRADAIQALIAKGEWDFELISSYSSQGMGALEFLLFDEQMIVDFTTNKSFIQALFTSMKKQIVVIRKSWEDENSAEFKAAKGNDSNSGLSDIVNAFLNHFEDIKRDRLSAPLGNMFITESDLTKAEGYYSSSIMEYIYLGLVKAEEIYLGKSSNGFEGPGLFTVLEKTGTAFSDSVSLAVQIKNQFKDLVALAKELSDSNKPLSELVANSDTKQKVKDLNNAWKALIPLLKSDMTRQALDIEISYFDGDND
jgi:predicted lipoprotein